MTVYLDTNIFVYAAGREHPHKAPCVKVLRKVADGDLVATTGVEVIQELVHLYSRRGQRKQGIDLARKVLALFPEPLPANGDAARVLCDLATRYPDHSARDLLHVATMLAHGITRIASVDADFDRVDEVERMTRA